MPTPNPFRILCVDDDEDAGEMLGLLLNSLQVEVTCVQTAAQAWTKINTKPFDLLVLDVWLPQLDGLEFCRQVRKFDSAVKILFYSGAAMDADRMRGLAAGADVYLVKPEVESLLKTVASLVGQSGARSNSQAWANVPTTTHALGTD